ncbi:EcoKI restriction-modification system protein HsdS [compost metagenome]
MTAPPYDHYKASGVEWLGDVPRHWRLAKLRYLADFVGGGTPSRDKPEFWGGDLPWVSPKDMKTELISGAQENITEAGLAGSSSSLIKPGAVLMVVRSGILQHTIPVAQNVVPVALNQDMKALRFNTECSPAFFVRWVQGLNHQLLLAWAKQGATVESIEQAYLADSVVPLPPPTEQTAIIAFLDRETGRIDALVEAQRRLIELLKEKRQAVISNAVTRGLDPATPMKDSGVEWLDQVPAHWEVTRLANLFREVNEPGDDSLPVLSVSIHDGVSDDEGDPAHSDRKITRSEDRTKYKRVEPNDLVYNMMRAWQGGFGTVQVVGAVSPAYVVARPSRPETAKFIELLLRTPKAVEEMRRRSRGVTDFRLRLYWDEFKDMCVVVPPTDDIRRVLDLVGERSSRWERLAVDAEIAIALLQERRSALISDAVTGKIDVRSLAPEQAEAA